MVILGPPERSKNREVTMVTVPHGEASQHGSCGTQFDGDALGQAGSCALLDLSGGFNGF